MSRISRIVLCLGLCLLTTLLLGHRWPSFADDGPQPAPGEPSETQEAETNAPIEAPVPGTETSSDASEQTTEADQTAEADDRATLRSDLAALRDELTRLQRELETLRADFEAQQEELTQTKRQLALVQDGQRTIQQQLSEAASGQHTTLRVGDMLSGPGSRGDLFNSTRYRLRIHNTTGNEHPLFVNGVEWTVRADEWTYVPIPLGPVAVHRPGYEPLEIAEDHVQWQSDNRGFYVDYDLDQHQVSLPTEQ